VIEFVIHGEPASKANSRQLVNRGKRVVSIKSEKALAYEVSAVRQIPGVARLMLEGEVAVELRIFYASQRPDLDESVVLDVMQARYVRVMAPNGSMLKVLVARGVYVNDRQVREKHVFHGIDKVDPRVEIKVWLRTQQGELDGQA